MLKILEQNATYIQYNWNFNMKDNSVFYKYIISINDYNENKEKIKNTFVLNAINDKEAFETLEILLSNDSTIKNITRVEFTIIGGVIYKEDKDETLIPIATFFYEP